jgi:putative flippase GtrA
VVERLPVSTTFVKFLIVGGIGYLVNQFTLFTVYDSPVFTFLPARGTDFDFILFTHTDIRLFIASVMAVEAAILSNFYWHERWTFRHRERRSLRPIRFLKFNCTSIGGPLIAIATVNILTPVFDMSPYIANTIGIGLGFIWNWVWNTLVIWPR